MKQIPRSYLIVILAVKTMAVSMNEVQIPNGKSLVVPVVSSEPVPPYKSSFVVPGVSSKEGHSHGKGVNIPGVPSNDGQSYGIGVAIPGVSTNRGPPHGNNIIVTTASLYEGSPQGNSLFFPDVTANETPPHGISAVIPSKTFSQGRGLLIPLVEGVTYEKTVKTGFLLLFGTLAFSVWVNRNRPIIFKGSRYVKDASRLDVLCSRYNTFGRINCNPREERPRYRRPLELSYASRDRNPNSYGILGATDRRNRDK